MVPKETQQDGSGISSISARHHIEPQAAGIRIIIWALVATACVGLAARYLAKASKAGLKRSNIGYDDYLVILALAFFVVQTILVDRAVANDPTAGLGEASPISNGKALELLYAARLVAVWCLCLAKLAATALIYAITPKPIYKNITIAIGSGITLWYFTSLWVIAFQHKPPQNWYLSSDSTYNLPSWWITYEIFNILTDIALVTLPLRIIFEIQVPLRRRITLSLPFGVRLIAIAPAAVAIFLWTNSAPHQVRIKPSLVWKTVICSAALQCLEILLVCFIFMKRFLDNVHAGFIAV